MIIVPWWSAVLFPGLGAVAGASAAALWFLVRGTPRREPRHAATRDHAAEPEQPLGAVLGPWEGPPAEPPRRGPAGRARVVHGLADMPETQLLPAVLSTPPGLARRGQASPDWPPGHRPRPWMQGEVGALIRRLGQDWP